MLANSNFLRYLRDYRSDIPCFQAFGHCIYNVDSELSLYLCGFCGKSGGGGGATV